MDSRARRAEALLTPSRVMISSDTAGAVKFTDPHEAVGAAVELVVEELEAKKRRKEGGRAAATAPAQAPDARASQPTAPTPLPAVRRSSVAEAGQVVAMFPASEVATLWF